MPNNFNNPDNPIGIYDSGVGGLTVLKTLIKKFPNEKFIYFADTANLPYGNKTKEQIIKYTTDIISWFQDTIQAKLVIAACHTSSALALEDIASNFSIPIIGTIHPMLNNLLTNNYKNIGIIATPASATSRVHENIFKKHGVKSNIISIGCPNFVPIIESIESLAAIDINHIELNNHAEIYLQPFIINNQNQENKLDTLIFGCTHYPLIKPNIAKFLHPEVIYLDPADCISQDVFDLLSKNNLLNLNNNIYNPEFYCSSDHDKFSNKLQAILNINAIAKLLIFTN
jgi:glutamate racemase